VQLLGDNLQAGALGAAEGLSVLRFLESGQRFNRIQMLAGARAPRAGSQKPTLAKPAYNS
jgi:hypothetical protein